MPELHLPLSGDVTQTINPWTWVFSPAIGPVSVYLGDSTNPDLERRILKTVGTYGRQIGQIGDALRVVLEKVDLGPLSEDQQDAVDALLAQLDAVDRVKSKDKTEASQAASRSFAAS
jgi:hypothetical protein